ncbi:stage III sporulation protein AF [Paenibacillus herberti]|uniref:stage III sporulation protein AF n=1 Tax=Paenibacillus herberti TaxID=1619309 RepID=UPI001595B3AE|nr:stage III sporulation protein AF [Paenibacillus herberti]
MLDWLSSWLRDVVAVVLLAAVVDLLLPNERMQRYARLITGLIVLLVILTPLLRLVQGDFQMKLETGYQEWNRELENSQVKMPSLDEIMRRAEIAAGSSQEQVVSLARTQLEAGIETAIEQETGAGVSAVDAAVKWDGQGSGTISSVVVTLALDSNGAPAGAEEGTGTPETVKESAIQPVQAVEIEVSPNDGGGQGQTGLDEGAKGGEDSVPVMGGSIEPADEGASVPPELERRIRALVSNGWQIGNGSIRVELEPSRSG